MKIAIIGYGNIGRVHFSLLEKLGFNVSAVCDINYDRIKDLAVNKYTDYKELLDVEKLDAVHICTPHYLHAQMVIDALNKNVNVLCEKPLCILESDIERILEAEKNSKAMLGVCHQNRYNLENRIAKQYLQDKKVISGRGQMIWHRNADYYRADAWRGKWKTEGGGVLINQALHTLDLMIWLMGEPKNVEAKLSNISLKGVIEVEDTAELKCLGDNFNFSFYATNSSPKDTPISVEIKTQTDLIKITNDKIIINGEEQTVNVCEEIYGKKCYGLGHLVLIKDFYECLRNGKKFEIDGNEAAKVVKVILTAYKKAKNQLLGE